MVAGASSDWTGRYGSPAVALVRPGDTDEVAAVVRWCRDAGLTVVPQGGNTGLVGGGVPRDTDSVVVSLSRLQRLDPVDTAIGQVTAGAGVTLRVLQRAAADAGWRYAVDFGSRDLATVGGMIATNAGGVSVFRYGSTRRQVLGVEAVLADGSIVSRLDGLVKDNSGYDLAGLLCGSEGTLAIVTAARLRLVPAADERSAAWITCAELDDALALARDFARVPDVESVELISPECVALLRARGHQVRGVPSSEEPGWALLVDAAATADGDGEWSERLTAAAATRDVSIGGDARTWRELWLLRDAVPEVIRGEGLPLKFDVAVPVAALERFLDALPAVVADADPAAKLWRFGHAADGNVHVNLTAGGAFSAELDEPLEEEALEDAVLGLVLELGGTISAEHGIGIAKAAWMDRARSAAELDAMRAVKHAFDPDRILNPGVLGL